MGSRLPFSSKAASTLSIVTTFLHPKFLPAQQELYISQLTKAAAPDFYTFTLAAETEKSE